MIGAKLAKLFEGMAHAIQLTVIDQREYYENHTGLLRCVADPSFQQQTSTAHHDWMEQPHKTLVVGALVEVRERSVRRNAISLSRPDSLLARSARHISLCTLPYARRHATYDALNAHISHSLRTGRG